MDPAVEMEPTSISHITWPDAQMKRKLVDIAEGRLQRNILLYGPPGTGKTTTLRILAEHYKDKMAEKSEMFIDVLPLSASQTGVDIIKQIENFASFMGRKIVIINELDNLGPKVQDRLRNAMDQTKGIALFFASTNDINLIRQPIQSRHFKAFWAYTPKAMFHLATLANERCNLGHDDEKLEKLVKQAGTDIRLLFDII